MKQLKPQSIAHIKRICNDFGIGVIGLCEEHLSLVVVQFNGMSEPIDVQSLKWQSTNKVIPFNKMHDRHIENIIIKYQNNELPKNCSGLRSFQWVGILLIESVLRVERPFLNLDLPEPIEIQFDPILSLLTDLVDQMPAQRDLNIMKYADADMQTKLLSHSLICVSNEIVKKRKELDELTASKMDLLGRLQKAEKERTILRSKLDS
jgi:hypothetical protein